MQGAALPHETGGHDVDDVLGFSRLFWASTVPPPLRLGQGREHHLYVGRRRRRRQRRLSTQTTRRPFNVFVEAVKPA